MLKLTKLGDATGSLSDSRLLMKGLGLTLLYRKTTFEIVPVAKPVHTLIFVAVGTHGNDGTGAA